MAPSTDDIENRVVKLERKLSVDPAQRVKDCLLRQEVYLAKLMRVPSDYYEQPLEKRAQILNSKPSQLCKSIVFQNGACPHDRCDDISDSKYLCVVVMYERKFNAERLKDYIWNLRPSSERLPRKRFNFQLAPSEVSDLLTGFSHNAVCPFGLISSIPVIICSTCMESPYLWMGGGEVDLKLGIASSDFVRATGARVACISDPR